MKEGQAGWGEGDEEEDVELLHLVEDARNGGIPLSGSGERDTIEDSSQTSVNQGRKVFLRTRKKIPFGTLPYLLVTKKSLFFLQATTENLYQKGAE